MKKLYLFIAVFFVCVSARSQDGGGSADFTIGPVQVDTVTAHATVDYLKGTFRLYNQTGADLIMWWKRTSKTLPTGWTSAICDTNLCYPDFVDSASFSLLANEEAPLFIYFYPTGNSGVGNVVIKIYAQWDEANAETINLTGVGVLTGIDEKPKAVNVLVYPNPITDHVNIYCEPNLNVRKIEVYNIIGSKVRSLDYKISINANRFDLVDLPAGRYFLKFLDNKNKVVQTKTFTKSQ
ncbi:MAG: T9SS type A sorting domain-containing protein [Bacteroidetes bacterium]|nr:T9SS type A sorting domain-containing protein [Bacteroidota bacterium]